MSLRSLALVPALASAAVLGSAALAAPATAAPSNNTFELGLDCSDGQQYTVTLVEHSDDAAAAHLVASRSVLIPTAFQFHITVFDPAGNVVDEITPPREVVHGASGTRLTTMTCTFSQYETEDIPGLGEVTIRVDGTVDAYLPH